MYLSFFVGAFKAVIVLMLLAISLQCLCVIMGLIIRNYEKQRAMIIVPVLFNFAAGMFLLALINCN
jgi:hypothetical protein